MVTTLIYYRRRVGLAQRAAHRPGQRRTDPAACAPPSAKLRWRSLIGQKMSGSAVGFSGSARYFISPTTPTMVCQGDLDGAPPGLIRLPIGSWPGQKRRATPWLTTTMLPSPCISVSLKVRPATKADAHRLKKIRRHAMDVRARPVLGGHRRLSFGGIEDGVGTAQRDVGRRRPRLPPRAAADAPQRLPQHGNGACIGARERRAPSARTVGRCAGASPAG